MINAILFLVACLGLVLGVVAIFSPFPVGAITIGSSLALMLSVSPRASQCMHSLRLNFPKFNKLLQPMENILEAKLPRFAAPFIKTRPHNISDGRSSPFDRS